MTTVQHLDPFEYGYMKGFQDRQANKSRQPSSHDGGHHVTVFNMGYELGYDHGVAFVCGHNEAQNILLDRLLF